MARSRVEFRGRARRIAVDPLDGDTLVIGWRQFDNVSSNFRQAGWAYSRDGGPTWSRRGRGVPRDPLTSGRLRIGQSAIGLRMGSMSAMLPP